MFERQEIKDIFLAIVAITLIFAYNPFNPILTLERLPISVIVVIIAFLFHELAHRFVARYYGANAFFKLWPFGIFLGFIFMFFGLKLVAPGAVVISPFRVRRYYVKPIGKEELGIIAASGPATNIFFGIIFKIFPLSFFQFLSQINAWLAFFNLIPFGPLDGKKVIDWNFWIWLFMISISLILFVII